MTDAYWLGVVGGLVVVVVVIEMVRRRFLRGPYAAVWVVLGSVSIVLALFPRIVGWAAHRTGVAVPFNLLLFLGCIAMLMMIMQLSAEAGRLLQRTRILAEDVALLRSEVTSLRLRDDAILQASLPGQATVSRPADR